MTDNSGLEILQVRTAVSKVMMREAKEKDVAKRVVQERMAIELGRALVQDKFFRQDDFADMVIFKATVFCITERDLGNMIDRVYAAGRASQPCPNVIGGAYRRMQENIEANKPKGPSQEDAKKLLEAIRVQEYPARAEDAFLAGGKSPFEMGPPGK